MITRSHVTQTSRADYVIKITYCIVGLVGYFQTRRQRQSLKIKEYEFQYWNPVFAKH